MGNSKLSQAIFHWDLPAALTCPGSSALCRDKCYALRNRYLYPQVQRRLHWCYEMSKRKDFPRLMVREIRRRGSAFVVRIHCSGDFHSAAYVRKWIEIIRSSPNTRFYGYTRSWRVRSIVPVLTELATLENMRLWYSCDAETEAPESVPDGVNVCWMQVDEQEEVPDVDLIFRDYPLRKESITRLGLNVICPAETPVGKRHGVNCGNCGICWKP